MGKIIFILGGARSGKSTYALELAEKSGKKVAFIATCVPCDKEMKERIGLHRKKRPLHWQTFEEPLELPRVLKKSGGKFDVVIIDCLTLLISNLLSENLNDRTIEGRIAQVLKMLKSAKYKSIIVSNEVGLGIVPRGRLARRFRDLAGRVNQIVAQKADDVFFMFSGIPVRPKRKGRRE